MVVLESIKSDIPLKDYFYFKYLIKVLLGENRSVDLLIDANDLGNAEAGEYIYDFYFKDDALFFRLAFVDFNGEEVLKAYKINKLIDAEFIRKYCPNIFKGTHKIIEFVNGLI